MRVSYDKKCRKFPFFTSYLYETKSKAPKILPAMKGEKLANFFYAKIEKSFPHIPSMRAPTFLHLFV